MVWPPDVPDGLITPPPLFFPSCASFKLHHILWYALLPAEPVPAPTIMMKLEIGLQSSFCVIRRPLSYHMISFFSHMIYFPLDITPYKLFRPYDRFGRSWFGLSWCGLTQIRPYIKLMFRPYHIFMRPTANPALYQMEKFYLNLKYYLNIHGYDE